MNQIVPANFGQISQRFAAVPAADDLSSGIQSSFGIIGYRGKVWATKYRGEEQQLMRDDGDGPKASIEVVILNASKTISKIYYEAGYVDGSTAPPDCFSNNGVTPEPTSAKIQHPVCATCPHNQWGSRITPAGKQGKSCADSKRLAVTPAGDLNNEAYGGPMLLRVPAASLQDLAMYGQKMQQMGYPYYAVSTKIAFDPAEAFPKFIFSGLRPLSDDEADIVLALREGHTVQRILSESEFQAPATGAGSAGAAGEAPLFEQAPDVGARTTQQVTQTQPAQTQPATSTVGDQARAAAAQQAATNVAPTNKPATKKEPAKATGFGGNAAPAKVAPVEKVQPTQQETVQREPAQKVEAQATASAETVNPRYAALLSAGLSPDHAKATIEAMGETVMVAAAPASQTVTPEVTKAPVTQAPVQQTQAPVTQVVEHHATEEAVTGEAQAGVAQASDFEENLDAMLADLLPQG